jgi:hypothetical protein
LEANYRADYKPENVSFDAGTREMASNQGGDFPPQVRDKRVTDIEGM